MTTYNGEASLEAKVEGASPDASSSAFYYNISLRPLNGEITKVDFMDTIMSSPVLRASDKNSVKLLFEAPVHSPTRLSIFYLPKSEGMGF